MNLSKNTVIFISIISVILFISFVFLGLYGIGGDLAGWCQSAIAVIEIPIIIYGFSKVLEEIRVKPEFDYGLIVGTVPTDLSKYKETSFPKEINITEVRTMVHLIIYNQGKLSAEDVSVFLKYKQYGEKCHPIIQYPAVLSPRLTNDKSLNEHLTTLHPHDYEKISFYIVLDNSEKCKNDLSINWLLEFSVEIYSKELIAPKTGSVIINVNHQKTISEETHS